MEVWIKFVEEQVPPARLTKIWSVMTIDGAENLGSISWYSAWRRYCFFPNFTTVFEEGCLRNIADWCEMQTKERKTERAADSKAQAKDGK